MENLAEALQSRLKGEVKDDAATREAYSRDASVFQVQPQVVVSPTDEEDLRSLIDFVHDHKGTSLTPRAGGTDMSGGPLSDSIVMDMTKYFKKIHEVGDDYAVTDPGVYYPDFERATLKRNLIMPSYPASKRICTVGGIVANNAGGEKSLAYGQTVDYVQELRVMLSDSHSYTFKPLSLNQLEKKMALPTFEGKVYKKIYTLIEKHYDLIQKAKPKVSKNSTGYMLWDTWDRKTFNLSKLFVGSQGTLGLITRINFKLVPVKKHSRMLVIFLHDTDKLGEIVNHVLQFKPETFETYDDATLKLALRFLPELSKVAKAKSTVNFFTQFLPEIKTILASGMPKLVLLAEFTGDHDKEVLATATEAQASLIDFKLQTLITRNREEAAKFWAVRRESFNLLRHHVTDKHTAPFIDDIIVPPETLPEFLPKLQAIMKDYNLTFTIAGHIGNGNFHIFPLMDMHDPNSPKIIIELSKRVFDLVFEYGGSMSGEHNDGMIRAPFLKQMYGERMYHLFAEVKKIFDPDNIFNPHKKIVRDNSFAEKHFLTQNQP